MTYIDDQKMSQGGGDPEYPVLFGMTVTPQIQGIGLGVLGVGAALYLFFNMILPVQEENSKLEADKTAKQTQIDQLKSGDAQKKIQKIKEELNQEQILQQQTLGMFSDNKTLETLLLDLNNLMTTRKGVLKNYTYDNQPSEQQVINDGSLGSAVNGKLKRQKVNLNVEGNFNQTKTFLQEIERLQPLLLIKNFQTQSNNANVYELKNNQLVPPGDSKLVTSFSVETILPLSAPPAPVEPAGQPGTPGAAPGAVTVPPIQTPATK